MCCILCDRALLVGRIVIYPSKFEAKPLDTHTHIRAHTHTHPSIFNAIKLCWWKRAIRELVNRHSSTKPSEEEIWGGVMRNPSGWQLNFEAQSLFLQACRHRYCKALLKKSRKMIQQQDL